MAYDGTCQPCDPDLVMDWAASGVGCDEQTSVANLPPIAGDRCPDDFFVAIQSVSTATGVALKTVATSLALQSLPSAAVCAEQSAGISVRAGTAAAGPLTELGPGVRAGADCGTAGVPCVGDCGWPPSEVPIDFSVVGASGGYVELHVDTSKSRGTAAVIDLEAEACIIH